MKKNSIFYVLYPRDKEIQKILDAVKVLSDDSQRTSAHITVRGPYKRQLNAQYIKSFSEIISNEFLRVSKVDNFFSDNQNTVFFKCDESDKLKSIWKKLTYKDFSPHITLYDGEDKKFAINLFNTLKENFHPFDFQVKELSCLKSENTMPLLKLKTTFDFDIFKNLLGINIDDIDSLDKNDNLSYIDTISKNISI